MGNPAKCLLFFSHPSDINDMEISWLVSCYAKVFGKVHPCVEERLDEFLGSLGEHATNEQLHTPSLVCYMLIVCGCGRDLTSTQCNELHDFMVKFHPSPSIDEVEELFLQFEGKDGKTFEENMQSGDMPTVLVSPYERLMKNKVSSPEWKF